MSAGLSQTPLAPSVRISGFLFFVSVAVCFSLAASPLIAGVSIGAATFAWLLFRHPLAMLGLLLAFMPVDYMAIEGGKFFGLPHMSLASACTKEVPLMLLILVLGWRNGVKLAAPDGWLLALFGIVAVSTILQGNRVGLATDVDFMIPYAAGRVARLTAAQEQAWAKRAVWIVAVLSVFGLGEIFILGEGPRTLLYLMTDGFTVDGILPSPFHAMGFAGMREASTMVGPPAFAALCMIALILWWVYLRSPWPGAMVAVGLVCSVTRFAWLGSAASITLLGILMGQRKRLAVYAALALLLFALSIPVLGLGDYLFATRSGQDLSEQSHKDSVLSGLKYMGEHPLGGGNQKIGPRPAEGNAAALTVETTYVAFGAEYGVAGFLCFAGFMSSVVRLAAREKSRLGYAALGILVGIGLGMTVFILHDDRRLVCWEWFPIGLLVQGSTKQAFFPPKVATSAP
jgi:hypothetical protein